MPVQGQGHHFSHSGGLQRSKVKSLKKRMSFGCLSDQWRLSISDIIRFEWTESAIRILIRRGARYYPILSANRKNIIKTWLFFVCFLIPPEFSSHAKG